MYPPLSLWHWSKPHTIDRHATVWVTQRSQQATSKYSSVSFNDYFINELLLTSYGFKNDTKKDSYFIFLSIQLVLLPSI